MHTVKRFGRRRGAASLRCRPLGWLCLAAIVACGGTDARAAAPRDDVSAANEYAAYGRLEPRALRECSGLAASRRHAGMIWAINDSGNRPELFAIDPRGRSLGVFDLRGVENIDWEDVALDDADHLIVADIGDNDARRREVRLIVVAEPDDPRQSGAIRTEAVIPFRYEGGPRDAEAIFAWGGELYVIDKQPLSLLTATTTLFRVPREAAGSGPPPVAVAVERYLFAGAVTAADLSADGRTLLVLTYTAVYLFERPDAASPFFARPPRITRISCRQAEGACFLLDGTRDLLIANESRDLFRIPRPWYESEQPFAPGWRFIPAAERKAAP